MDLSLAMKGLCQRMEGLSQQTKGLSGTTEDLSKRTETRSATTHLGTSQCGTIPCKSPSSGSHRCYAVPASATLPQIGRA